MPKKPWVSHSLLRCINKKDQLYRDSIRNENDPVCTRVYKNYRNALNKLLRNAKKKYFECKIKDACGNPAKTWKIIKSVISSTDPVLPDEVTTSDGLKSNEPAVICNALSEHFATVGARFSRTTVASDNDPTLETFMGTFVDVSIYLRPLTHDEVRKNYL